MSSAVGGSASWNTFRIRIADGEISVWFNPMSYAVGRSAARSMFRVMVADGETSVWFNPMSSAIGGGAAWNMLRFLIADGEISVWFNPMYLEVFQNGNFPMPGERSALIQAVPPRITYRDANFAFEAVA